MPTAASSAPARTVASAPRGSRAEVVAVAGPHGNRLMVHGIRPGSRIVIEGDAPFGGPCIVRVGRSRVAIDRRLAGAIAVVLRPAATGLDAT